MSTQGLEGLEHTVQLTHAWINELDRRLQWDNKGRSYRLLVHPREAATLTTETWLSLAQPNAGSWWPAWTQWLNAHSGSPQSPPHMGLPGSREESLPLAPGHYVMEK